MQSSSERRKLVMAMTMQSEYAWQVLAKCAAGLAVIVLIAVMGTRDLPADATSLSRASAAAEPAGENAKMRPQDHRKRVFDERRARFEGDTGRHTVANETVRQQDRLPAVLLR